VYIESLNNATTDPVLIWLNGGPGCSSLLGLFNENGPFVFDDGESQIKPNPYPWNSRANLLYIESPATVGYSKGTGPTDNSHNDLSQSIDLFASLTVFYTFWPELLKNDLWISGESYAGVYNPYLAWQIHLSN
jgi:carboxypeptidase C (cathepsin A)